MTAHLLRIIPMAENPSRGHLWWRGQGYPCALGRGGVRPASRKNEGDDASPAGIFALCRLYYRRDWLELPETGLPVREITRDLGWCDDPECRAYNSAVELPHPGSAEDLWRDDRVYDLLVEFGHNQDPTVPHMGSAIFLHVARHDFSPTRGCVAVAKEALAEILPGLRPQTMIRIHMP